MQIPIKCELCPRRCKQDRNKNKGLCGAGSSVRVARAALHFWEEPCISGTKGSGAVFFSGCSLGCCYCQNYRISAENFGKDISCDKLAEIFCRLEDEGAHNINLVTATPYLPWVLEALNKANVKIPIVYNTSGYETIESLELLRGVVDIWLADLKYVSSDLSYEYSRAADYFTVASAAIKMMANMVGKPIIGEDGIMKSGLIVRHLALPNHTDDSIAVLRWLNSELGKDTFILSIMSQYTPFYKANEHKKLSRRISTYEYKKVVNEAIDLGLNNGYMQAKSSAKEEYTPDFTLEGVE
ncbi:MAG: radical SAM protein [Oscillospiraceae bacterium]